jgi:hypothetical protein
MTQTPSDMGLQGVAAWEEYFKNQVEANVNVVHESGNRQERKLDLTPSHYKNSDFKKFLIKSLSNVLRNRGMELLEFSRSSDLIICVRGPEGCNFELFIENKKRGIREPTLFTDKYKEAECAISRCVVSLYLNRIEQKKEPRDVLVISNDGDTFGICMAAMPGRISEENYRKFGNKLLWATRSTVFDMNCLFEIMETHLKLKKFTFCQAICPYIAIILGDGNDYFEGLSKISSKYLLTALNQDIYSNLVTINDETHKVTIDLETMTKYIFAAYQLKNTTPPYEDSAIRQINFIIEWYIQYIISHYYGDDIPPDFQPIEIKKIASKKTSSKHPLVESESNS